MRSLDLAIRATRPLFRHLMHGRATIFLLHRVSNAGGGIAGHSIENVRDAIQALRASGARIVSIRQIVEASNRGSGLGSDCVAFTIDDGFADQAELARSAFAALDCPVTIFLITGFLDNRIWPWDDRLALILKQTVATTLTISIGDGVLQLASRTPEERKKALALLRQRCKLIPNRDLYAVVDRIASQAGVLLPERAPSAYAPMTWDVARDLESHGVEFGPHSVTHRIFSRLDADEAEAEILVSWRRLQEELRNPLPVFAWPTGRTADFTARDIDLVGQAGLTAHVTAEDDYARFLSVADAREPPALKRFALPTHLFRVLQYGSAIERIKQILRVQYPR